jgi:hypothetical protein
MTHVTSDCLGAFFHRYGWQFEAQADGRFESGWQGERRYYPLAVRWTPATVTFEVRPFLSVSPGAHGAWHEWPALTRELLEVNQQLKLVRLVASSSGELSLTCRVLTAGFNYASFARILEVLGYYADVLQAEISPRLMARGYLGAPSDVPMLLS